MYRVLFVILIFLGNCFSSETFYYKSRPFYCSDYGGNIANIMWAKVTKNNDTINVKLSKKHVLTDDYGLYKYDYTFKNTEDVISHKRDKMKISGLKKLAKNQKLVLHSIKYCTNIKNVDLLPISSPQTSIKKYLNVLNARPVKSDQYLRAYDIYDTYPDPIYILPILDQNSTSYSIKNSWEKLRKDYIKDVSEQLLKIDIDEKTARKIIKDIKDTRVRTDLRGRFPKSLLNIVGSFQIFWAIVHRNNPEKAKAFMVRDYEQLCRNIKMLPYVSMDYIVSGIPLQMWTKEYANQLLEWSTKCKKFGGWESAYKNYAKDLKNDWNRTQKKIAEHAVFVKYLNAKFEQAKTIEGLKKTNFLNISYKDKKQFPNIPKRVLDVVQNYVVPQYLKSIYPNIIENLENNLKQVKNIDNFVNYCSNNLLTYASGEFKKQLLVNCNNLTYKYFNKRINETIDFYLKKAQESIKNDDISVSKLVRYCRNNIPAIKNHNTANENMWNDCDKKIYPFVVDFAKSKHNFYLEQVNKLAVSEKSIKTLEDIKKSFFISERLPNNNLKKATRFVNDYFSDVLVKIDELYKKIDKKVSQEKTKYYQRLLDDEENISVLRKALDDIRENISYRSDKSLPLLKRVYYDFESSFVDKISQIKCDNRFKSYGFPKKFKNKKLVIPKIVRNRNSELIIDFKNFICKGNNPSIIGETKKGLFSDTYFLRKSITYRGQPVSIKLEFDDEDDKISFKDLKVFGAKFNNIKFEYPKKERILCLIRPYKCLD